MVTYIAGLVSGYRASRAGSAKSLNTLLFLMYALVKTGPAKNRRDLTAFSRFNDFLVLLFGPSFSSRAFSISPSQQSLITNILYVLLASTERYTLRQQYCTQMNSTCTYGRHAVCSSDRPVTDLFAGQLSSLRYARVVHAQLPMCNVASWQCQRRGAEVDRSVQGHSSKSIGGSGWRWRRHAGLCRRSIAERTASVSQTDSQVDDVTVDEAAELRSDRYLGAAGVVPPHSDESLLSGTSRVAGTVVHFSLAGVTWPVRPMTSSRCFDVTSGGG